MLINQVILVVILNVVEVEIEFSYFDEEEEKDFYYDTSANFDEREKTNSIIGSYK